MAFGVSLQTTFRPGYGLNRPIWGAALTMFGLESVGLRLDLTRLGFDRRNRAWNRPIYLLESPNVGLTSANMGSDRRRLGCSRPASGWSRPCLCWAARRHLCRTRPKFGWTRRTFGFGSGEIGLDSAKFDQFGLANLRLDKTPSLGWTRLRRGCLGTGPSVVFPAVNDMHGGRCAGGSTRTSPLWRRRRRTSFPRGRT